MAQSSTQRYLFQGQLLHFWCRCCEIPGSGLQPCAESPLLQAWDLEVLEPLPEDGPAHCCVCTRLCRVEAALVSTPSSFFCFTYFLGSSGWSANLSLGDLWAQPRIEAHCPHFLKVSF